MIGKALLAFSLVFLFRVAAAQFPPPPPSPASSNSGNADFLVVGAYLDQTMQPKNLTQTLQECLGDSKCKAIIDLAAAYVGIDSSKMTSAAARIAPPRQEGEEGYFSYSLPVGYEYCRSVVRTVSIVPATGERGSVMGVSAAGNAVSVYTWTPKQGFGGGRTWVEADITIIGVASDRAAAHRRSGKCTPTSTHPIANCRGARAPGNSGDGRPPCGTFND